MSFILKIIDVFLFLIVNNEYYKKDSFILNCLFINYRRILPIPNSLTHLN